MFVVWWLLFDVRCLALPNCQQASVPWPVLSVHYLVIVVFCFVFVVLCLCVVYVKYSSYCSSCFGKFSCVVSYSGSGSCVVFCSEAP